MNKLIIFYFSIILAVLELSAAPVRNPLPEEAIKRCLDKIESLGSYNKQYILNNEQHLLRLRNGDFSQLKEMITLQDFDEFLDCLVRETTKGQEKLFIEQNEKALTKARKGE